MPSQPRLSPPASLHQALSPPGPLVDISTRSNIESAEPSSPNLAKSSCQGAQAKFPGLTESLWGQMLAREEENEEHQENKVPQTQTRSHALESPQASVADVATPMPLTRPFPEDTPVALAHPRQCSRMLPELPLEKVEQAKFPGLTRSLWGQMSAHEEENEDWGQMIAHEEENEEHLPTAVEQSPLEPVTETDSVLHAASEQVRGLGGLPQLDFCDGERPVKITFISFRAPSSSPPTTSRAMTKPLSGDSAPKNWAPGPFGIQDSDRHDLSQFVAAFWTSRGPGYCGASSEAAFMADSQDHALQGALAGATQEMPAQEWAQEKRAQEVCACGLDLAVCGACEGEMDAAPAVTDASTHPACMGDSPCAAFMDPSTEAYFFMGASPDASFWEDEQTAVGWVQQEGEMEAALMCMLELTKNAVTDASTHPACMGDSPCAAFMDPPPEAYFFMGASPDASFSEDEQTAAAFMDPSPEEVFMGASPDASFSEDEQTAVGNPMVIHPQQSLVPAVAAPMQPQPLAPPLTGQQQQHQQQQLQLQQMQQIQQMQAQQQQQQLLAQQQMVAQRLAYMQQMQQQAAMAQQAHMAAAQGAQQQSGPPSQPFQLNLSEWLPSESAASSSRVSSAAASEPPRRVRLEQHLFLVSQTLPAASPEAATPPVFAAAALVGTGPGIFSDAPVRRQLLIHNSI